jgi:hypothetical protein
MTTDAGGASSPVPLTQLTTLGPAGCVPANRLFAEPGVEVLLVEPTDRTATCSSPCREGSASCWATRAPRGTVRPVLSGRRSGRVVDPGQNTRRVQLVRPGRPSTEGPRSLEADSHVCTHPATGPGRPKHLVVSVFDACHGVASAGANPRGAASG